MKTTRASERRQEKSVLKVKPPHSTNPIENKSQPPLAGRVEKRSLQTTVSRYKRNEITTQMTGNALLHGTVEVRTSLPKTRRQNVEPKELAPSATKASTKIVEKVEKFNSNARSTTRSNQSVPMKQTKLTDRGISQKRIDLNSRESHPVRSNASLGGNVQSVLATNTALLKQPRRSNASNIIRENAKNSVSIKKEPLSASKVGARRAEERNHLNALEKQIQQQKNTITQLEQSINMSRSEDEAVAPKEFKTKAKREKISPKKALLRKQLKIQLKAQRELLKVQQQIFEQANRAQSEILKLMAALGTDDEVSEDETSNETDEDEEMSEEFVEKPEESANNTKLTFFVEEEVEEQELQDENELMQEQQMKDEIVYEDMLINESNYQNESFADQVQTIDYNSGLLSTNGDQNVVVVVQTEEGDEEFELLEVDETDEFKVEDVNPLAECTDNNGIEFVTPDDFEQSMRLEIVAAEDESLHYRIVASDNGDESKQFTIKKRTPLAKQPVRLDTESIIDVLPKEEKPTNDENSSNNLLNEKHSSAKNTNEYVQKVIQEAAPNDDNKFSCPICGEVVSNRYSLGPHILRIHAKQKNKICPHCDRAFTCTGDLTRHIRIHTGSKPFQCTHPKCDYAFRSSGDLYKHLRRHENTNEETSRPHECEICNRRFERGYDLKRHKLTHSKHEEGVGYRCEYCPKRFVRKDQYKVHTYRHLGIKPFKCPDCNRGFGDFSNCSKHIKQNACGMVDTKSLFTCDICDKAFKSKVGIKLHVVKCSEVSRRRRELLAEKTKMKVESG